MKPFLIILVVLMLAIFSCEELEPTNPADPSFTLKAPTLITAQAISDIRIDITWQNNEEHTKEFIIQRKSGTGDYGIIGIVAKDILTFVDSACVLGTEFSYVVQSKVESNVSPISNALNKATSFPGPNNLNVLAISDESVRLTWTDNTTYESGFKIERDAGSGFTEIATVSADVTEYTDSGLTFGQDYSYRVAAYTSSNTSSWTTITAATEFPAPSDLSATAISDSEVQLAWVDNTSYETGFKIERDDGSGFAMIGTVLSDATEYTDSGLTVDQTYSYRVAAYTSGNTSTWATIIVTTEFPAPTNLSATAISDSEIEFSWTDNCSFEDGYHIERDFGSGFTEIGIVSSDVTEFTDIGLTFGQSYNYRVAAFTSLNTSSWVTLTAATEFPAPTDLSASIVGDGEIRLTWADNTGYEIGFNVERDDGGGFVEIGTVSADVTEYTDSGLIFGQSYSYRVSAHTAMNTSDYSNIVTGTACNNCFQDIDGNVYTTVQIGDQVWMAENLKVTHYHDGTAIPNLTDAEDWTSTSSGAYCFYFNNASNEVDTYGALYNWYAVADSRNIAPSGWHVPSDDEWTDLQTYLSNNGHSGTEGSALKSTTGWVSGGNGTDDYDFTALPGGYRGYYDGDYVSMGGYGYFWSATEFDSSTAWYRQLKGSESGVNRSSDSKGYGFSVRCVRD